MPDRRIKYSKKHRPLIDALIESGSFPAMYHVLAFAAALGVKEPSAGRRRLEGPSADPIKQSYFDENGFETLIDLLAMWSEKTPDVFDGSDENEDIRATIFEEYANGGLNFLSSKLEGQYDKTAGIMLILNQHRPHATEEDEDEDKEFKDLVGLG